MPIDGSACRLSKPSQLPEPPEHAAHSSVGRHFGLGHKIAGALDPIPPYYEVVRPAPTRAGLAERGKCRTGGIMDIIILEDTTRAADIECGQFWTLPILYTSLLRKVSRVRLGLFMLAAL